MTDVLTEPVAAKRKQPQQQARKPFWRRLLYAMAQQPSDLFVDNAMWNGNMREAYLQALKGDRHALEAEGSAKQDNA